MEVKLLGWLEVATERGPVELARKKARALLALLALRPQTVISTDRLVDGLWGESPPKTAAASVQNLVSALRKTMGPSAFVTRSPGYLLNVEPERIDVHRFYSLIEEASRIVASDARVARLRAALELWRGPALADFALEPFAQAEIVRLEEARLRAREALIEAELELGRHADVVADLESIVAEHPLRERTNALLMLALYRAGRQADALEVYRRTRVALVEQLGIDPGPPLRELERAILRQDQALEAPFDPLGRKLPPASNLPAVPSKLVGRTRELADVRALLEHGRLVTLIGPGGIGKTRLAHEVASLEAEQYERTFFVALSGVDDIASVDAAVARAVGVDEPLIDVLRGCRVLLFIDNFEQVVGAAPSVAQWLRELDGLTVLVTSRVPLRISGEHLYDVPQLGEPDAITLFVERARAVARDFEQDDQIMLGIVRRLEGLPLALELAAARVRTLPPDKLLERLTNKLSLLTGGPRDAPEHQRTLQASIDWSYNLLEQHERHVLTSLAVFAGGFSLDAAERICRTDVLTLGALGDNSVIKRDASRYRMLESIREYALGKLESTPEADAIRQRHCEYFVDLIEEAEPDLGDPDVRDLLRAENENLRAAIDWSCRGRRPDLSFRLATGLFRYWLNEGQLTEARSWLERILATASRQDRLTVRALAMLANVGEIQGDFEQVRAVARCQNELASQIGDEVGVADSLLSVGIAAEGEGRFEEALTYYEQASHLTDSFGDEREGLSVRADASLLLGQLASRLGDAERAHAALTGSLSLNRELGRDREVGWNLEALGVAELEANRVAEAFPPLTEALSLGLDRELVRLVVWALEALGAAYAAAEQPIHAAHALGAAAAALEAIEEPLPRDRRQRDQAVALVTRQIGHARFQLAWEQGRVLPPETFLDPDRRSTIRPLVGEGVAGN